MTIAIISDTHIGDSASRLVDKKGIFSQKLPAYGKLKKGILEFTNGSPLKYLVLNGDVMDFSINSIDQSISIAQPFFKQISRDKLTEHIIYIPGNHDKQVWDGIQWDTSIIGNLSEYYLPKPFKRIQPVHIPAKGDIKLEGIKKDKKGKYGNLFLKGLFGDPDNNPTIILAYPNLYIERKDNPTIIVTHGHMFETAWVLLSDLFHGVSGLPDEIGLKELEEWNVPITSMICTGVGSGGDVSRLFYKIQRQLYEKNTKLLSRTLDRVLPRLKNEFGFPWYKKILIPDWLIKKIIISTASKTEDPRSLEKYFDFDKKKVEHFKNFFRATKNELKRLKLPDSNTIIFGHTHYPYSAREPYSPKILPELTFYNTGGWLKESKAEVFLMDDKRFTSFSV